MMLEDEFALEHKCDAVSLPRINSENESTDHNQKPLKVLCQNLIFIAKKS